MISVIELLTFPSKDLDRVDLPKSNGSENENVVVIRKVSEPINITPELKAIDPDLKSQRIRRR